jgi:ferredoxin
MGVGDCPILFPDVFHVNVAGDSPAKEIISRGLVNRPKRIKLAFQACPTLESN